MLENALRQSLLISQGSFMIFITRPISGIALGFASLLLLSNLFPYFKQRRLAYEEFKE
jgi:putative tricarboxylic transport membrane protein